MCLFNIYTDASATGYGVYHGSHEMLLHLPQPCSLFTYILMVSIKVTQIKVFFKKILLAKECQKKIQNSSFIQKIEMKHKMGLNVRKLSSGVCEQHKRRSACAYAQSDQRLCYSIF